MATFLDKAAAAAASIPPSERFVVTQAYDASRLPLVGGATYREASSSAGYPRSSYFMSQPPDARLWLIDDTRGVEPEQLGAIGNDEADDFDALSDAFNHFRWVRLNAASYRFNRTLVVTNAVTIMGAGPLHSRLVATFDGTGLRFVGRLPHTYVQQITFSGVSLSRLGATQPTAGYALELIEGNGCTFNHFLFMNFYEGILIEGGQLNIFTNFQGFGYQGAAVATQGTSLLRTRPGWLFKLMKVALDPAETTRLSHFTLSGSPYKVIEDVIDLRSTDGVQFSQGYCAFGGRSLLKIELAAEAEPHFIGATSFSQIYFDGGTGGTNHTLYVPPFDVEGLIVGVTFTACTFNMGPNNECRGAVVRGSPDHRASTMSFNACWFGNGRSTIRGVTPKALDIDGAGFGRYTLTGCDFFNCEVGIEAANVAYLGVIGGTMRSVTEAAIVYGPGTQRASLHGVDFDNCKLDISGEANVGQLDIDGYTTTNPSGRREGEMTPEVTFGGSPSGAVYKVRSGRWRRSGSFVYFHAIVDLASKGTARGNLELRLPIPAAPAAGESFPCTATISPTEKSVAAQPISTRVMASDGGAIIRFYRMGPEGFLTPLTDAAILPTTGLRVEGFYSI